MATDHDILIRLDEKMDTVIEWQRDHKEACHRDHERYDVELKALRDWKMKEAGALGLLTVLLNVAWRWVFGHGRN